MAAPLAGLAQGAASQVIGSHIGEKFGRRASEHQAKLTLGNQQKWFQYLKKQGLTPWEIQGAQGWPGDGGSSSAFGTQASKGKEVNEAQVAKQRMETDKQIAEIGAKPQHEKNQLESMRLEIEAMKAQGQMRTSWSPPFQKEMKVLSMGVQNMIVSSVEAILDQHGMSPLRNPDKFDMQKAIDLIMGKRHQIQKRVENSQEPDGTRMGTNSADTLTQRALDKYLQAPNLSLIHI